MEQSVSQLLFIAGEYTTCCYLGLLLLAIVLVWQLDGLRPVGVMVADKPAPYIRIASLSNGTRFSRSIGFASYATSC